MRTNMWLYRVQDSTSDSSSHLSCKSEAYLKLLDGYLRESDEALTKENFSQASEKLWGAAAETVKAVAAVKGSELRSHRGLWEFVTELGRGHPEWDLLNLFHAANSLHMNFYENWLTPEAVARGAGAVKEFVGKLKELIC